MAPVQLGACLTVVDNGSVRSVNDSHEIGFTLANLGAAPARITHALLTLKGSPHSVEPGAYVRGLGEAPEALNRQRRIGFPIDAELAKELTPGNGVTFPEGTTLDVSYSDDCGDHEAHWALATGPRPA
jgi:hypothetical protein